ncbi:MAG: ATP-binding protein [Myxococcota bacterium]
MSRSRFLSPNKGHSYEELKAILPGALRAGVSVLVLGHPGVGKSALAGDLAELFGLPLIDIRLAQQEPADLAGVYFPDQDRECLTLLPPAWVKDLVERPGFLFLDEVNAAVSRLHQAVAYQMVLERRLGPFQFHPDTVVLAAGNLAEDNALATPLSSALANRFAHFRLRVDTGAWIKWAEQGHIRPELRAFIGRHGDEALYKRAPDDTIFPSPRTWEMASRLLDQVDEAHHSDVLEACVGRPSARAFAGFQKLYKRVRPEKVLTGKQKIDFTKGRSREPSFMHAAVSAIGAWVQNEGPVTNEHVPHLVSFMRSPGLDREYAMLLLVQLKTNQSVMRKLKALPAFRDLAGEIVGLHAGMYA